MRQYALRLRHDRPRGKTTFITAARNAAVAIDIVLNVENAPERAIEWIAEQPDCEYCDQPATRRVIETQEPVCRGCARSQTDGPLREYVTTLAVTQWPRWAWVGDKLDVAPKSQWDDRVERGTPIVGLTLQGEPFSGLYGGEWELDTAGRVVIVNYPDGLRGNSRGTFLRSDTVRRAQS